jgi:hypothetical protein
MLRCQAELLPSPHPAPIIPGIPTSLRWTSSLVEGIRASAHGRPAGCFLAAGRYVPSRKVECAVMVVSVTDRDRVLFRVDPGNENRVTMVVVSSSTWCGAEDSDDIGTRLPGRRQYKSGGEFVKSRTFSTQRSRHPHSLFARTQQDTAIPANTRTTPHTSRNGMFEISQRKPVMSKSIRFAGGTVHAQKEVPTAAAANTKPMKYKNFRIPFTLSLRTDPQSRRRER